MLRTALPATAGTFGSMAHTFRCLCLHSDSFLVLHLHFIPLQHRYAHVFPAGYPHTSSYCLLSLTHLSVIQYNTTKAVAHRSSSHSFRYPSLAFISVQCSPNAVNICARLRCDLLRCRHPSLIPAVCFTSMPYTVCRSDYILFPSASKSHSQPRTVVPPSRGFSGSPLPVPASVRYGLASFGRRRFYL